MPLILSLAQSENWIKLLLFAKVLTFGRQIITKIQDKIYPRSAINLLKLGLTEFRLDQIV